MADQLIRLAAGPMADFAAALDTAQEAMDQLALAMALARDDQLTPQEQAAVLDVYQEYGR